MAPASLADLTAHLSERPWDGEESIPVSEWGKDHWSTLAYAETRCVDHRGVLANEQMRCNQRRHRKLMGRQQIMAHRNIPLLHPPTRLSGGREILRHDDWDCLNDAVAAGFLEIVSEEDRRTDQVVGGTVVAVNLTAAGLKVCAALRAHKANGGSLGTFIVPKPTAEEGLMTSAQIVAPQRTDLPPAIAEAEWEVRRLVEALREAKATLTNRLNEWAQTQDMPAPGERISIERRGRGEETWEVIRIIGDIHWDEVRPVACCALVKKNGERGERTANFVREPGGEWLRTWYGGG